ncbi:hypothetical protein SDC9_86744 [bioreactor metagenome]|uniref:Uncharacterized protein n=1 Tax=bioreactor metagenome TaxID=1076179 RepID=A0A644ZGY3_9ZZZZ
MFALMISHKSQNRLVKRRDSLIDFNPKETTLPSPERGVFSRYTPNQAQKAQVPMPYRANLTSKRPERMNQIVSKMRKNTKKCQRSSLSKRFSPLFLSGILCSPLFWNHNRPLFLSCRFFHRNKDPADTWESSLKTGRVFLPF